MEAVFHGGPAAGVSRGDRPSGNNPLALVVKPDQVALMCKLLPAQTRDAIADTFGIGANTWNKIKAREPIRASVAKRLLGRLDSLHQQSI